MMTTGSLAYSLCRLVSLSLDYGTVYRMLSRGGTVLGRRRGVAGRGCSVQMATGRAPAWSPASRDERCPWSGIKSMPAFTSLRRWMLGGCAGERSPHTCTRTDSDMQLTADLFAKKSL
jgi:hypothetical protein